MHKTGSSLSGDCQPLYYYLNGMLCSHESVLIGYFAVSQTVIELVRMEGWNNPPSQYLSICKISQCDGFRVKSTSVLGFSVF